MNSSKNRLAVGGVCLACLVASAFADVEVCSDSGQVSIENEFINLTFDLERGNYSIYNKQDAFMAVKDAMPVLQPGTGKFFVQTFRFPNLAYVWTSESVQDEFGSGQRLTLTGRADEGYFPTRILRFSLYDGQPQIIMGWGVRNQLKMPIRVQEFWPLYGGQLFTEQKAEKLQTLRSSAGARGNHVEDGGVRGGPNPVENGLMATYLVDGTRYSFVAGGAKYDEFIRGVSVGKKYLLSAPRGLNYKGHKLSLKIHDPYGKRIEPGSTYLSEDTFYLDVVTRDPFAAYEKYGAALQLANRAKPNLYYYPTMCGWNTSNPHYGVGVQCNRSDLLVKQMDHAVEKGLNKYFTPGVRLEPDNYIGPQSLGNTQQGWWTDETLVRGNKFAGKYDTWPKFAQAIIKRGGVPITYTQSSIPSVDFSQAHPEYLLHNDNSLAFTHYWHVNPPVGYDYSDPGFQKHFYEAWKYIGDAGVQGVKVDYPATAWVVDGSGFEDQSYTTTKAYRKQFELLRAALGPKANIHERVLGRGVPATDATAGLVDLQRVWGDSSKVTPEMASKIGLRWYKNRKVYQYYEDSKNFYSSASSVQAQKKKKSEASKNFFDESDKSDDGLVPASDRYRRTFLTLSGFLSGKLDLGTSYCTMTPKIIRQLSRIYPVINEQKSPRPADMLLRKHPTTYVYDVTDQWVQVMLFNPDEKETMDISAPLSGDMAETGSLGLNPKKNYHVFDFWNQEYVGKIKGTGALTRPLEPVSALMYSVREAQPHPQVISTDRHFMQGMVELSNVNWEPARKILSGNAETVEGEPMIITVAMNDSSFKAVRSDIGTVDAKFVSQDLLELKIQSEDGGCLRFEIEFN